MMGGCVSSSAMSGPRKDRLTANLHIHFGVVLHEPNYVPNVGVSDDEGKDQGDE